MSAAPGKRDRQSGLSTLEALVAVALLGIAFLPLLVFQSQITRTYARFNQEYDIAIMQRNALAVLREMNPAATPSGSVTLGANQTLSWTSSPLTQQAQNVGFPAGDGEFSVAVFRVTAVVADGQGASRTETTLTVDRLGWRKSGMPASSLDALALEFGSQ